MLDEPQTLRNQTVQLTLQLREAQTQAKTNICMQLTASINLRVHDINLTKLHNFGQQHQQ